MKRVPPSTEPAAQGRAAASHPWGSSRDLSALEERLETCPDPQGWQRTSERQQGQAGAHPSIRPVMGYFFLMQQPQSPGCLGQEPSWPPGLGPAMVWLWEELYHLMLPCTIQAPCLGEGFHAPKLTALLQALQSPGSCSEPLGHGSLSSHHHPGSPAPPGEPQLTPTQRQRSLCYCHLHKGISEDAGYRVLAFV